MRSKARAALAHKRAKHSVRQKDKRQEILLWSLAFLFVGFVLSFSFWIGKEIYDVRSKAQVVGWVENDRSVIKGSAWFTQHAYADCPTTAAGFWPVTRGDCLFNEPGGGPPPEDQVKVKDPPGLYYKHMLPTDFYRTIPSLLINISFTNITKQSIEQTLQTAVQQNPMSYANLSVDSLNLGLEGGNTGAKVRAASIWVHPTLERPIANAIGLLQRAKNLYKPFIEGATGGTISDADLTELYTAALNRCGGSSLNNDQSGRGVSKTIGDYIVIVQFWSNGESSLGITNDCNIHIVKLTTAAPSQVVPSFGCLGCVPTAAPTIPLPTVAPTIAQPPFTLNPTTIPTPPIISETPPSTSPPSRPGLIQILLALLKIVLTFFLTLLGGRHGG